MSCDDVVKVYENVRLELGPQNVQQSLERSWSGVKPEWHDLELHQSPTE